MRLLDLHRVLMVLAFSLTACSGNYSATPGGDQSPTPGPKKVATPQDFFAESVAPNMNTCRSCHVPGASADTAKGKRFMLSSNSAEDYSNLQTSWTTLGKGVETNRILLKASNTDPEPHTAGALWPKGSVQYNNMKILFACWDNPAGCAALLAGGGSVNPAELPLLGDLDATGGRNYAAVFCENKADNIALPRDPRELIAGDNLNSNKYAVFYNDAFEICETPTLFENQAKQNALLVVKGGKPVYSAKPRPKTCGQWRTAVESGRKYIMSNPITGAVITVQSIVNLGKYLGYNIPANPTAADAPALNKMLAEVSQQRYGWPAHPYHNPAPMPGEDPNKTNGGSIQLPVALVQVKNGDGTWSGKLGVTCFGCHIGQIGTGEVLGNSAKRDGHPELYGGSSSGMFVSLNGSNTDNGLALYDLDRANSVLGPLGGFGGNPTALNPNTFNANLNTPGYMANRTRGTNAADQEIVNVTLGRDMDSLDWKNPLLEPTLLGKLIPSIPMTGGDQDMPTWWWTHNKTRYLWVGFGSAGSSRGNYFPSSTNPNDGHWSKAREGDYQDLDMWLNAVEAPAYPDGYCTNADGTPVEGAKPHCINRALAEQGAILFHSKNLWADAGNSDIPKPPGGNGSCAGCHGAYSPRYINQPGYLPDPNLAGMSGYTVPMDILGTDSAQSDFYSNFGVNLSKSWFSYPDAAPGYRFPEDKTAYEEANDEGKGNEGTCKLAAKGGYTAQPLHGVWASGPYFHNGSIPTVWDVLKPSTRPDVWLRQQIPMAEAVAGLGGRGFDTQMVRAYDYEKLGWKYERKTCDARTDASSYSCQASTYIPSALDLFFKSYKVLADYISPPYITGPGGNEIDQRAIYNTHAYSKSNSGHAFTKVLTDQERKALIEYLKTL